MSNPATDNAARFLQEAINEARRSGVSRLPTVKQLAGLAGVSHPTMLSAVRKMVAAGVLESYRRRGLLLKDHSIPRPRLFPAETPRPRWLDLAIRIERDIQNGIHEQGTVLPPLKQLAAEYGTGYRTLHRALVTLVDHGSLRPHKRGFAVRRIGSLRRQSTVVLITRGDRMGNLAETTPRMHEQILAVERECSQHNLRLQVFTYDYEPGYVYPTERWREFVTGENVRDSTLGFIVWPVTMGKEALDDLVLRLARMRKPVSVLDEDGGVVLPRISPAECSVRLFAMAASSPLPTRALGRFLLALGHRTVAFISPFQSAAWSRSRHQGLRQAFAMAGYENAVREFVDDQALDVRSQEMTDAIYRAIDTFTSAVRSGSEGLDHRLADALRILRWRIGATMQEQVKREALVGLFQRALTEAPEATAWVGANDAVAVEALRFLRERGRRVPEDVSVVGLDDGLLAHLHKLTSYNFNSPALIRGMIGHILTPEQRLWRGERRPDRVQFDGYVVIRDTTGRARTVYSGGPIAGSGL